MAKKETKNLTSQAQIDATRRWEDRNREYTRKKNYQRSARLFVRTYADQEDMDELNEIFSNENPNASEDENKNTKETEDGKSWCK